MYTYEATRQTVKKGSSSVFCKLKLLVIIGTNVNGFLNELIFYFWNRLGSSGFTSAL